VAALREIAARLRLSGDNPFRARAYAAGASAIEGLSDAELRRRLRRDTLTDIEGIGAAISGVVAELARHGRSDVLDRLRASAPAALIELSQVPGISRLRARKLHDALGVGSVDELREAARAGRIRTVKGFGPKTEAAILAALDAYAESSRVLRLIDAREEAERLADFVRSQPGVSAVEVAGGVRRWEEEIGELTLVVAVAGEPTPVAAHVAHYPPLARVERAEVGRLVARLASGVRVDLRFVPTARRGVALLEETGPPAHVSTLQDLAAQRGVDWNSLSAPDESAVYAAAGVAVVAPEARAWAPLPPPADLEDLVTAADIRGLVHCHTTESDGRHTLEQMARAADALGFAYMTVTDHSPAASYAGGLTVDRLRAQWDEIARVQERVRVRLLRGTESDILADGSLDYPDAILEQLDGIIASIHARHRMDAAAMTERLLRAMKLPVFKIWGHPLGRLVLRRPPIPCDLAAVLDAAAGGRVAIELSGDPYRLDLPPAWIPAARARRIPFVISTDAHATGDFDNLAYGVAMARRGGVRRHEVLNAQSCDAFRAAVRP